jgi:hypothetical protein
MRTSFLLSRKCTDWLQTLREYIEDTESPRKFWLWSGLWIIGSALQRKVWIPFGLDTIYPNLFILFIAPPGWSRKGAPVALAKRILEDIQIPVGIDSPTKRHLTKRLHTLSETEQFFYKGRNYGQAPLALPSKELSSFLAVDPKGMIEALTDLYDSHDKWDYGTSGKGEDLLRNLCISCLFATTPDWIANNLPEGSVGGGFTSRFILVSGLGKYKEVSWPPIPDAKIYKMLKKDLETIRHLVGEFQIEPEAKEIYDKWYATIEPWAKQLGDPRLYNNFSRVHVQVIKTAMTLHVAKKDSLIIEPSDMTRSIRLIRDIYNTASDVFSGHGKNPLAKTMDQCIKLCREFGVITATKLLQLNYRDASRKTILEIVENLEAMKMIKAEADKDTGEIFITWQGKR